MRISDPTVLAMQLTDEANIADAQYIILSCIRNACLLTPIHNLASTSQVARGETVDDTVHQRAQYKDNTLRD